MARGNLAALQKRNRFVVFAFAEKIEPFEPRDLRFELVADHFLPAGKQVAERQRVVEVFVLVGDENVNLRSTNRHTTTCSCSGRIFSRITEDCEHTTTPSTTRHNPPLFAPVRSPERRWLISMERGEANWIIWDQNPIIMGLECADSATNCGFRCRWTSKR